jgi:hypothetical protein
VTDYFASSYDLLTSGTSTRGATRRTIIIIIIIIIITRRATVVLSETLRDFQKYRLTLFREVLAGGWGGKSMWTRANYNANRPALRVDSGSATVGARDAHV